MKTLVAQTQFTISHLDNAYTVLLSNEVQQFATNSSRVPTTNASYYTDVTIYYGTQKREDFTVGTVASANGITVTKSGSRVTFTVNTGTTISTDSGTFTIPITIDGKSFSKIFSWSCAKQGQTGSTGAAAKSVDITASSQIFKSTDGGATFSPDTIKLTPIFQGGISFSKWQYSTNGGTSWTDVTSGSNGLTISSGVLTIAKTCSLFTGSVTSLSFKCISNNATYFDVMTVLKLYDVTDIQIGGRNLLLHSGKKITSSTYLMKSYSTSELKPNTKYTMVLKGSIASPNRFGVWFDGGSSHGGYFPYNQTDTAEYITITTPAALTTTTVDVYNYPSTTASKSTIDWAAMYEGEILPPLDWTPAPEDIEEQFTAVTDTVKTAQSKIDAVEGKITNKVWRSDVITIQDSEGNIREKTLVDHLVQNMIDSNGITNTVQDIRTDLGNPNDPASGTSIYSKITKAQQEADKFTWLVKSGNSSSSMTLTDSFLSILARDIDITGKVTFNSFDSATKTQIQTAVNKVDDWSYDSTSIDGGKIYTGTVTADKIAAYSITTDKLVVGDLSNYATVNEKFPESMLPSGHLYGGTLITDGYITNNLNAPRTYLMLCDFTRNKFTDTDELYYTLSGHTDASQMIDCQISILFFNELQRDENNNVIGVTPEDIHVDGELFNLTKPSEFEWGKDRYIEGTIKLSGISVENYKYFIIGVFTNGYNSGYKFIKNVSINRKITGGIIVDGGITAECLAVDSIRSRNYTAGSGTYSNQGTMFNLEGSGYIKSQNFAITSTGTAYFRGTINATSGTIGSTSSGWQISDNTIKGLSSSSKIISGVLESSNYIADTSGVKIDLNTGIIDTPAFKINEDGTGIIAGFSFNYHDIIGRDATISLYATGTGVSSISNAITLDCYQTGLTVDHVNGIVAMKNGDFYQNDIKLTEVISANGGYCLKYSNGWAIATIWKSVSFTTGIAWGNLWYGDCGKPLGALPITFKNIIYRNITIDDGGTYWLLWYPGNESNWSGTIFPIGATKQTATQKLIFRGVCIGTWK